MPPWWGPVVASIAAAAAVVGALIAVGILVGAW
jgi:hypothetical protein